MTIEVVAFLQSLQNDFLEFFFQFISFLGEEYVYIILIGTLYYAIDKKFGEFMAFTLFVSIGLNTIIKSIVKAQRPFQKYPLRVENLRPQTSSGYSFPSGHTMNISSVMFALSFYLKKKALWVIASILVICMMLSRMYLGVHFLEDVVVGGILGLGVAYGLYQVFSRLNQTSLHRLYLVIAIVLLPFVFILQDESFYKAYGSILGFVIAMLYEKRYVNFSLNVSIIKKVIRVISGLVIMILIKIGFKEFYSLFVEDGTTLFWYFDLLRYFLISFIGLGLYPQLFKKWKF